MTITQDTSVPLVVVCGSTGIQGGSAIKALAESDKAYRVRGLTRDPTKPSARELANQGVEMVQVSLTVENEPVVLKAFEGANIVFVSPPVIMPIQLSCSSSRYGGISKAMTNFWEHMSKQRVCHNFSFCRSSTRKTNFINPGN